MNDFMKKDTVIDCTLLLTISIIKKQIKLPILWTQKPQTPQFKPNSILEDAEIVRCRVSTFTSELRHFCLRSGFLWRTSHGCEHIERNTKNNKQTYLHKVQYFLEPSTDLSF